MEIWKIPSLSRYTFPEAEAEGGSAESRHHLLLGSGRSWWALFVLHLPPRKSLSPGVSRVCLMEQHCSADWGNSSDDPKRTGFHFGNANGFFKLKCNSKALKSGRCVSHCCSLLKQQKKPKQTKKIFADDGVSLNSPFLLTLLVMCCAGAEGMPKADQDGGPVALQWGRLIRNGGQSLKSFSAPGGVTWPSTPTWQGGVLCAHAQLGSVALQRAEMFVALAW